MSSRRSQRWFTQAKRLFPGGVNSPVRAFGAVGGAPVFFRSAKGPYLTDVDGRTYVDLVGSWGPMVLGHAHPAVERAVMAAVKRGTSYGACSPLEVELGALVRRAFPSMERLRFVSSGTEATMSALRLARAVTGRNKILKFSGCYHGHVDSMLVKAGSGVATFGLSSSAGVPAEWARDTVVVPYNDLDACRAVLKKIGSSVAAVIVEPVAANMGVVPPLPGFLAGLRALTRRYGCLLIFDEVISGFRVAYGGAQELYGIRPDLTCLGKIIGGGLPVGAYGGAAKWMKRVAPLGPVYQAGTLSGNPVAMAAGIAMLKGLKQPGLYQKLEALGRRLQAGVEADLKGAACVSRVGSLQTLFFLPRPPRNYEEAAGADQRAFARYFQAMLRQGVYLPPSQFEAWFVSAAHTPSLMDRVVRAHRRALREAVSG